MLRRTRFIVPTFNKSTPNKIGEEIDVSGKNTLIETENDCFRVAIAEESIDANVDGRHLFCARVENAGRYVGLEFGFNPLETFDSNESPFFANNGFRGCVVNLFSGSLCYPVAQCRDVIDDKISNKAKEIIVILTISNNGKKKEIRFLFDGKESKSTDVSKFLNGDFLYPAICLVRSDV
jgi:hypothetical protein